MKNKIAVVPDKEDPLLLRFYLDGRECLNASKLEMMTMHNKWIPCVFHYEERRQYDGFNVKIPFVLIWMKAWDHLIGQNNLPAIIQGNPLDGVYRWTNTKAGVEA